MTHFFSLASNSEECLMKVPTRLYICSFSIILLENMRQSMNKLREDASFPIIYRNVWVRQDLFYHLSTNYEDHLEYHKIIDALDVLIG